MSEQGTPRRILIADDDPDRLRSSVERLQHEGFTVLSAQDGLEALDRAREELPDAIILNLLLRRIDGLRVCEILKSNPATTNIPVLLTAGVHVDADEGQRALAAGADRVLSDLGPLSTRAGRQLGAGPDLVAAARTTTSPSQSICSGCVSCWSATSRSSGCAQNGRAWSPG